MHSPLQSPTCVHARWLPHRSELNPACVQAPVRSWLCLSRTTLSMQGLFYLQCWCAISRCKACAHACTHSCLHACMRVSRQTCKCCDHVCPLAVICACMYAFAAGDSIYHGPCQARASAIGCAQSRVEICRQTHSATIWTMHSAHVPIHVVTVFPICARV